MLDPYPRGLRTWVPRLGVPFQSDESTSPLAGLRYKGGAFIQFGTYRSYLTRSRSLGTSPLGGASHGYGGTGPSLEGGRSQGTRHGSCSFSATRGCGQFRARLSSAASSSGFWLPLSSGTGTGTTN